MAEFEAEMAGLDDLAVSAATAERLMVSSNIVRRRTQVAESRLIAILDRHAAVNGGVAPEDVMTNSGMSGRAARDAANRARTQNDLGAALADDEMADEKSPDDSNSEAPPNPPELNPENLEAIARAARSLSLPAEQELFNTRRAELARMAIDLDPTVFKVRLKVIVMQIRAEAATTTDERHRKASKVGSWINREGMRAINSDLDRERGDAIWAAIEREMRSLAANAERTDGEPLQLGANLAAEALFQIVMRAFDPAAKTSRPLIGILVDSDTLTDGRHDGSVAERFNDPGSNVSDETLRRFLCDADLQAIVMNGDEPLAVGRRYRTATAAQRFALRALYDSCSFPGCDVPFDWCHIHHLDWWEHGGVTDLDNLTPLCQRHHHLAHEGGWQLKLRPDRSLEVTCPNGQPHGASKPHGVVTRWQDGAHDHAANHHRSTHHRELSNN